MCSFHLWKSSSVTINRPVISFDKFLWINLFLKIMGMLIYFIYELIYS